MDEDGTETRTYPYGSLFSHVIGYNDSQFGKTGLESAQNFDLLTSNAFFMEKIQNEFKGEKDQGDTVVTTLDAELQQAAYDALGENKGAVIVMEADTGKILTLVSKPDFCLLYTSQVRCRMEEQKGVHTGVSDMAHAWMPVRLMQSIL